MLLVTVTVISLLLAATMSFVVWNLVRTQRQRSAARVAALANEMSSDADAHESLAMFAPIAHPDTVAGASEDSTSTSSTGLFASPVVTDRSPIARFAPALLAGVILVGGMATTAVWLTGGTSSAAAAKGGRPLELLSLNHVLNDGRLSVTGLVRNPDGNAPAERLTAVLFLFDNEGGFLASARAPIDFTALAPGEESPFSVSLDAPPRVARYRVSFRREEGGIAAHVDRRAGRQP